MKEEKNPKITETKNNILQITGTKLLKFLNLDQSHTFKTNKNTELGYTIFSFSQDATEVATVYINNNFLFSSLVKADYDDKHQKVFHILDGAINEPYGKLNIDFRTVALQKEKGIAVARLEDTGLVAKIRFGETQPNSFNKLTHPTGRNLNDFRLIARAKIKGSSLRDMIEFCPTFAYIDFVKKYDQRIDVILMRDLTQYSRLATISDSDLVKSLPANLINGIDLTSDKLSKNTIVRRLQKLLQPLDIDTSDLHDSNVFVTGEKFMIIDI